MRFLRTEDLLVLLCLHEVVGIDGFVFFLQDNSGALLDMGGDMPQGSGSSAPSVADSPATAPAIPWLGGICSVN